MKLPRAGLATLGFLAIWAFLIVFVLFPLTRVFYDAFTTESGAFTLANFHEFFTDKYYLRSLWKSLALGAAAVATTSVIGIAVALLLVRYEFPFRNLFSYLTMLPMILAPLVGVLGFTFILGRAGTLNVILMDWFGLKHPVNFMYGVHGVLLVETVHLFPMMTLSILDALGKVDSTLEEAAEGMGATGWRRFKDVTFPLMTPGYVSGALLVFIWTFADFITPLVLGVQDLLAAQAYLNIVQFVDRRIFRMGIVISAFLVLLAIVFVLAARQYVAIKDYSSLAYSKVERRRLGPVARWAAVAFLSLLMLVAAIPQVGVVLAAFGRGWALTPIPVHWTLEFFEAVSIDTPKFIVNSFSFSGLALRMRLRSPAFVPSLEFMPTVEFWQNSSKISAFDVKTTRRDATLGGDVRWVFAHAHWQPYAGAGLALHFLDDRLQAPTLGVPDRQSSTVRGAVAMLGGVQFGMTDKLGSFVEVKFHDVAGYRQVKFNTGLGWNY